ncbi:uncharacterized protein K452DRAFT_232202 [Aplosporella prunicola CBS 121167]|uniref:Calcineurin-like phosphoesterase domain-containing protein n=1 Tax=Aplosporella prunicola CBS 121167 TaxID=1176127 RepID=A0A6A6BB56_9PEZI|nr:uncharacterized protein K452DRAFT_232202 [Aplosporella prunicola CBS 121167]KAF2139711.1 hypothetical protein K452DRAFT_232202 [Aplosporella prunicola CBS 121167]
MSAEPILRKTRIVCISDTHNQTPKLPAGDVLIHAGDLTNQGSFSELRKTISWLEKAPFEAKIVVAGNHDITLDESFYDQHGLYFHNQNPQNPKECIRLLKSSPSITYLQNESTTVQLTKPDGPQTRFTVFGSPYSPYCDSTWAFQYEREDGQKIWDTIPLDTDILVTHAPPQHHCDTSSKGGPDGCKALREALWRVRPSLHVCGHRHEGRGVHRVRWKLDLPMVKQLEASTDIWRDPGAGTNKQSLVDLSAKGGNPIDTCYAHGTHVAENHVSCSAAARPLPSSPVDVIPTSRALYCSPCLQPQPSQAVDAIISQNVTQSPMNALGQYDSGELISRLDSYRLAAVSGRLGKRETCVINAAIKAQSYNYGDPKRTNKPIVVDIDLPSWPNTGPGRRD